jgi:hypothetical protein
VGVREIQTARYWDLGVGAFLNGIGTFRDYLESIPPAPEKSDPRFPHLVLVEPRIGLEALCRLAGIGGLFPKADQRISTCTECDAEAQQPVWILMQDGRRNKGKTIRECRQAFDTDETALTALQGVCSFLQYPSVVRTFNDSEGYAMDLPGTIIANEPCMTPYLGIFDQAWLSFDKDEKAHPKMGTASRLRRFFGSSF